jgi:hypothetical protein
VGGTAGRGGGDRGDAWYDPAHSRRPASDAPQSDSTSNASSGVPMLTLLGQRYRID